MEECEQNVENVENVENLRWGPDMMDGEINLYTVSSDGHVFNWILMQNTLTNSNIIRMFFANGTVPGPDGTEMKLTSAGHCMRFDPSNPEIFLVGTDEGLIYKCSTSNSSKYLFTYKAHYMAVYQIDFNRYNSKIFISCGADWRIKIWEDMRHEPLFIYDLGSSVGDVKWAPYSSTVFAAVTTMGKVFVYDLNVNRNTPACSQLLVPKRKNKLTTLVFNEKLPFLIVGDVNGTIISLKISPNLRIMVKPPKKQLYLTQHYLQTQKLEKLLTTVRELEGCAEAAAAAPPKP
ncbi:dynein intermediate chain 2, ciliary-like [Teleopsis dalmanni]|uniref:dynein intermediate chain 2, ciliary-like n=1 Tax=Teleopsis dalmanni TaxID=139649 RepID=UPI0018CEA0D0|nr:dynein intermediate chain 2, ciliary-like [Teleopsis dalmanni]